MAKIESLTDAQIADIARPDAFGFPFLWEAMARREIRRDASVLGDGTAAETLAR